MRIVIVVTALAVITGCLSSPEYTQHPAADSIFLERSVGLAAPASVTAAGGAFAARQQAATASENVGDSPRFGTASDMVIRTGQTSIEVDSLEHAVAQVRLLASRVGGYVANTTMQTGRGQLRAATLEVKIPADRFEDGLAGLSALGKLESVNVNAEDVGEEFTDVTARMTNARRLETRLIELLATRTGKLKDVLDVERELARVREEIERYEGRLRYLRAHAALSTLTIYMHEPLPVVGHAGSSVIGEAFKQAWRNFVGLVAAGIRSLGVVIPLAVLAAALWVSVKRLSLASLRSVVRSPGSVPGAPGPSC
jgi:hypothetical protein